jgi:hypothetical protein
MDAALATAAAAPSGSPAEVLPWPSAIPDSSSTAPLTHEELHSLLQGDVEADEYEALLAQVARARGALDVAVGEGLAELTVGERLIRLGFSCLGDYSREVLGLQERTAEGLAFLARELRSRPLLRAAVCAGEVKPRAAQAVLRLARGKAEAAWVERAKCSTVRALEAMVRAELALTGPAPEPEPWVALCAAMEPGDREVLDRVLDLAGRVLEHGAGRPARLEALAQEYLGAHPAQPLEEHAAGDGVAVRARSRAGARERAEARLEAETEAWRLLRSPLPVPAPVEGLDGRASAQDLDARVRQLAAMRASWDDYLGNLALGVLQSGLHRALGFASFDHFCRERLGLSARSVRQRVALERRLCEVPALKVAHRGGLPYERLQVLSRLPDGEIAGWVERANSLTCIALRRAIETGQEGQLCAAGVFCARVPLGVSRTVREAFRAVRATEGACLPDGKCLLALARHFLATWEGLVPRRQTPLQRIRERDLVHCRFPGCSRWASQAHHIVKRSQGGGDEPENLVSLCTRHHLRGVHGGWLRVTGRAPDRLAFELTVAQGQGSTARW